MCLGLRFAIQEKRKKNPNWFITDSWKNIQQLIQEENYEAAVDVWNDENALTDLITTKQVSQLVTVFDLKPEDFDL